MAAKAISDDIKIIAQFLASRSDPAMPWQDFTRDAFKLRRQLKERGDYRICPARVPA
jgi:hypothetical protein